MKKWTEQRAPRGSRLEKSQLADQEARPWDPESSSSPPKRLTRFPRPAALEEHFPAGKRRAECQGVELEMIFMLSNISCIFQVFFHELNIVFIILKKSNDSFKMRRQWLSAEFSEILSSPQQVHGLFLCAVRAG